MILYIREGSDILKKIVYFMMIIAVFCFLSTFANSLDVTEELIPLESEDINNGFIVKLKSNLGNKAIEQLTGITLMSEFDDEQIVQLLDENLENTSQLIPEIGMMKVDDESTVQMLIDAGLVEYSEPNAKMYLCGYDYTENPYFSLQWGHSYINSSFSWNAGVFGEGVRVAVIDSGVFPHEDIVNNLADGRSYVDTTTDDLFGHGTFVAGIIAAQCNNLGVVGLAHRATIVPFKVTNGKNLDMADAIRAMKDAVDEFDCDVLNLSIGTSVDFSSLREAVDYVLSHENAPIIVAAAGNNGTTDYSYPASYDDVVSVANVEKNSDGTLKIRATSQHNDKVNIAAPGTKVPSLSHSDTGYIYNSGTSFSTPHVSAAAALAKCIRPGSSLTAKQFMTVLANTADRSYLTESQGSQYWGSGLLDVEKLLTYVMKTKNSSFYVSPPDKQVYGNNTSVYITNLTGKTTDFGKLSVYNYLSNDGTFLRLNAIKRLSIVLEKDESREISFTDLGMFGHVKYSMLSDKLKPLIVPLGTALVEEKATG